MRSIVKPFVEAVAEITTPMSFGYVVIYVRDGIMGSV